MGRRMGATVNKQYLPLNGRPILGHTVALFDQHPLIDKIYVIIPADEFELCRRASSGRIRCIMVCRPVLPVPTTFC